MKYAGDSLIVSYIEALEFVTILDFTDKFSLS